MSRATETRSTGCGTHCVKTGDGDDERSGRRAMKGRQVLAACFPLFGSLLVWPLLSIANRPVLLAGAPTLVVYLFAVWVAIIAILLVAAQRAGDDPP